MSKKAPGIKMGFKSDTIDLNINQILPLKESPKNLDDSQKFKQILASIKEIGIVEPPVVSSSGKGIYVLVDGHLRIEALKKLKIAEVTCLISTDDEAFTYNKFVSRLAAIQEHRMIMKAIERGVPEEKIAKALNVDVASIVKKRTLLVGICPEVAEMLKDKIISAGIFTILRRMKSFRQIQVVSTMEASNCYTLPYAKAFFAATPKDQLVNPKKPKNVKGLTEQEINQMESEMESLTRESRLVEESYAQDMFNLTLAKGYINTLLDNSRVIRYLSQTHPDILSEFQKIAEMTSLKDKAAA